MITASDCAAKKIARQEPGQKGLNMEQVSPETTAMSKVVAKACSWYDRRKAVQAKPDDAREAGRYKASRRELAEAVEKFRKSGQSGQP